KVAAARGRDDRVSRGGGARLDRGKGARLDLQAVLGERGEDALVERGDTVVVEARSDGAVYRHLLGGAVEELAVALDLLANVPQRVLAALAVELVDGDEVRKIEHVDFLELARRAVLGRHHVERSIDERHDRRIALADTGGLHEHEVESGDLAGRNDFGKALGDFALGAARPHRARGARARHDRRPARADTGGLHTPEVDSGDLAGRNALGKAVGVVAVGAACGKGAQDRAAPGDRVHADAVDRKGRRYFG